MNKNKRKNFFLQYFSSYLFVFLLPFLLVIFTYITATEIITTQYNYQIKNVLIQTRDIIDSRLNELKSIAFSLRSDDNISTFRQDWLIKDEKDVIFSAYKACRSIPQYNTVNSSISDVTLFFGNQKSIFLLSSGHSACYTGSMLKTCLNRTDIDYLTLYQFLTAEHFYERFVTFPSSGPAAQEVYFMSNMNSFYQSDYAAVILIKMSDSFFTDMLSKATLEGQGTSFILTEDNALISCYQGHASPTLDSEKLAELIHLGNMDNDGSFLFENNQVNISHSDFNGWTYYSLVPRDLILKDMTLMSQLIMTVTIVVLTLGVLFCFCLTKRNSRPLKHIIHALTTVYEYGLFDSTNEFKFIENAVSALIEQNSLLIAQEKDRKLLLDTEILRKLLLGEYSDNKEFLHKLNQSSIRLEGKPYITGYMHIHGLAYTEGRHNPTLSSIIKYLEAAIYGELHLLLIDESNIVFLIVYEEKLSDGTFPLLLKETLENLGHSVLQEKGCHIDFFLSASLHGYENVHEGYEQCKKIARNVLKKNTQFVYTDDDLPPYQPIYRYTVEQEIKMLQLLQHGSMEKFKTFLNDIYIQNYEKLDLSEGMKHNLLTSIQNSVLGNLGSYQANPRISLLLAEINQQATIDALFSSLVSLKEEIQESTCRIVKAGSEDDKQSILDYLLKNYGNSCLNLYSLCEALDMSEQTACRLFHEMDSSFASILENIRIEAACRLLLDNEITIKTIAEKTGYSSDASFRRAFKRVLGISPREYVKRIHTRNNNL